MEQVMNRKYLLFIFFFFLFFSITGYCIATEISQSAPSIVWFKTFGQTGQDDALALILSSDGFVVGGMTESPSLGVDDSWIKRIDSEGNTKLTKHYDMKIQDEARTIIEVENGNLVMGGATEPLGESYPKDASVIKVDKSGNLLWNTTFGDPMKDELVLNIAPKTENGYIFSGSVEDWRIGSHDALVVSLNNTGYVEWFRTYSRGTGADAQSIIVLNDGYLVAGYADPSNMSNYDGWIMKIDSNGDPVWENTYGGSGIDAVHKIIDLGDRTYLAVGETVPESTNTTDVWVFRIDQSGKILWDNHYGGDADDKGFNICKVPDGYLVSGWTESFGAGMRDAWVIRLDPNGKALWSKTIGGVSNDMASSADIMKDSSIIVAGLTDSFGAGQYDAMVSKLGWE